MIHLDVSGGQLFQITQGLEVAAIVIDPPLEAQLSQCLDQAGHMFPVLHDGCFGDLEQQPLLELAILRQIFLQP